MYECQWLAGIRVWRGQECREEPNYFGAAVDTLAACNNLLILTW